MGFELPRLRVKLDRILQNYVDFIKRPAFYLTELQGDLRTVDSSLSAACESLITGGSDLQKLDNFMDELKLFLSASTADTFYPEWEEILKKPVGNLPGFGPKLAEALTGFGIATIKDILYAKPMRYEHLAANAPGGRAVLEGKFEDSAVIRTKNGKRILQAAFSTGHGFFYCVWLHFSPQFPLSVLNKGEIYHMYGAVTRYNGAAAIFHPEFLEPREVGTVRPVYSVPSKLSQKVYRKGLDHALKKYTEYLNEVLPEYIRFQHRYPTLRGALHLLHDPVGIENAASIVSREHPALQRLVYEELFYLQLRLLLRKHSYIQHEGIRYDTGRPLLDEIAPQMPFRLTDAQRQALREILGDMRSSVQMNRLLQGDVGCGKTIVAFVAALVAVKNGYQAVILAPTEVLAEQHFRNLEKFLAGTGYFAAFLTGSVKTKDKKEIKDAIASGSVQIVVGTHAVIQEDVLFHRLGFAVIDEQHRFGVKQRKALMSKGFVPDILLMTATPIPRTLALTCYGDLELSEITAKPSGRISPITKAFRAEKLKSAFGYVKEHLQDGQRAYFVYPAIEESEKVNLKSVTKNFEEVKKQFPRKNVGLLHGKMKSEEKSQMLSDFQRGKVDILVSTTVVEVGVDVKDATVIMIENADCFGLAQLHQLRGRVGRSDIQSYCVLVASEEISESGFRRLQAMEQFTSGFKLAELDLELRGQGDFFGVKQSGIPEFQFADIIKDGHIVRKARADAQAALQDDPQLAKPKNKLLRTVLMQRWQDEYELFLVG